MPNQNECDHVVAANNSMFFSKPQVSTLLDVKNGHTYFELKFNYCPNCGAKIDWVKIKEELDDK